MVSLMATGWPKGPKQENLKLIVIAHESDEGRITGIEVGTEKLGQLNQIIGSLAE